jgi:hypothetical protein
MAVIDQNLTFRKVEERLAVETDPVLVRNLELLLKHMKGEASLDLDAVMSTVSTDARYQNFAGNLVTGPVGKPAVLKFYEGFAASGAHKLHLDIDRLVVDRECILTEGVMRMAYPGRTLQAMGVEIEDLDSDYLFETHMAIIWPIAADGLFVGEDAYTGGDGFAGIADRKIDPKDVVMYEPAGALA